MARARDLVTRGLMLAALLTLCARGAADISQVNLKGWYTEVTPSDHPSGPRVCLSAALPVSKQPPPLAGWATPEAAHDNVTVQTTKDNEMMPNHCFHDRQDVEQPDGRLHLQLNVMLYRQTDKGAVTGRQTPVLIRPEVAPTTTTVIKIHIEPNL